MRARREVVSKWMGIFAVGCVILALTYAGGAQFLMPGPLTTAHSTLGKCTDCHSNVHDGQFGWLPAVVTAADPGKDSKKCLSCHKLGPAALNPHGFPAGELKLSTERLNPIAATAPVPVAARVINVLFPVAESLAGNVFCATCHQEHQGKHFDLKAMANEKCRTCHRVQFDSFHNGHPKFENYPFRRRTRIFFDHASHFGKHIPETLKKNKIPKSEIPGVCADCHQVGADARHMEVKSFAQICSACHLGQIVGAERATGPKGIAMLTLPGLDVATLKIRKAAIGEWPERSEAELTPLMKFLIGWDAGRRRMLDRIGNLDLLDLANASQADIAAVETLVWEIKSLIFALSTSRTSDVLKRLDLVAGENIGPELVAKLTANMPRDVLMNAQREWLPNLTAEMKKRGPGLWTTTTAGSGPPDRPDRSIPAFRAHRPPVQPVAKRETAKIPEGGKIVPAENQRAKAGAAAKAPTSAKSAPAESAPAERAPAAIDPDQSDTLLKDADEILKEEERLRQKQGRIEIESRVSVAQAKGRLRINEFGQIVGDTEEADRKTPPADAIRADDKKPDQAANPPAPSTAPATGEATKAVKSTNAPDTENAARRPPAPPAVAAPSPARRSTPARAPDPVDAETWTEFGGWYRQDYAILYKPTGHMDGFMRAWLDFTGRLFGKDGNNLAAPVFNLLTDKDAQGQCTKCHSVDAGRGASRGVNWKPFSMATRESLFTSFAHEPHFGLLGEKGCLTCHDLNDSKGHQDTYKGHDPKVFVSNFKRVEQKQCASCHGNNVAREDCLLCHNYHVGGVRTPMMDTKLPN